MNKNKKLSQLSRIDILCISVLILSALFFFIRIYPIIFAVHDDMRNYTLVRRGMLVENADAIQDAAKEGFASIEGDLQELTDSLEVDMQTVDPDAEANLEELIGRIGEALENSVAE